LRIKRGAGDCPVDRVPAAEIEKIVIDQVRLVHLIRLEAPARAHQLLSRASCRQISFDKSGDFTELEKVRATLGSFPARYYPTLLVCSVDTAAPNLTTLIDLIIGLNKAIGREGHWQSRVLRNDLDWWQKSHRIRSLSGQQP
jgi:hypothetical protein